MSSGDDDLDELSDEKSDKSSEKKSEKYDDDSSAFWPELPASLAALESAYEAARDDAFRLESTVETLRGRATPSGARVSPPAPRTRGALLGSSRGDSSTGSSAPLFPHPVCQQARRGTRRGARAASRAVVARRRAGARPEGAA